MRRHTPEFITHLEENEIFVFGSNSEGIHGAGSARTAYDHFGAIIGQASGLQGRSYAVITKNDVKVSRSSNIEDVAKEVANLFVFAHMNPQYTFLVTKIGSLRAGFTLEEMREIFVSMAEVTPENIILPKEYESRP